MEPPPDPFAPARARTVRTDEDFMLASSDDAGMMSSLRLAGAAALCAALLLSACAKKTDQTTTTSTDASSATAAPAADTSASAAPDAAATAAPDATTSAAPNAAATTAAGSTTTTSTSSGTNGASSGDYITLPVYPGATEAPDAGSMSVTTNTGSVVMKVYATKDDAKKVADWYKAHLPATFKDSIMTVDTKTIGTFVNERTDGDQSVIVATQDVTTTRIQLTTKHGK
jgi:hypothetical protein